MVIINRLNELNEETIDITNHLVKARNGLERSIKILSESGAPLLIIDESEDNLSKVTEILSFYDV